MQENTIGLKVSSPGQLLFRILGVSAVVMGLIGSTLGSGWSEQAFKYFENIALMETIGTYAPYFPFVPFFPIFLIMSGAFLIVKSRQLKP